MSRQSATIRELALKFPQFAGLGEHTKRGEAMATEALADRSDGTAPPEPQTPFLIRAFLDIEDDHWVAIAMDYTIVGVGASPDEAVDRMLCLFWEYVRVCEEEGKTLAEARRPLPIKWRLELRARGALCSALRVLHRAGRARDIQVMVPSGSHVGRYASC